MTLKTHLYDWHVENGAKMVPFAGWDMPIHYVSQIQEHHAIRKDKGIFDVSHMLAVDLKGEKVTEFLMLLIANDIRKAKVGKALYTCMLNEAGGVVDDLIVYYLDENYYRLVVNAGNRQKDVNWIKASAKEFNVDVTTRDDLSIIAVQGPNARQSALEIFNDNLKAQAGELKPFSLCFDESTLIARTGYTGEDGFEIMLPHDQVNNFWQKLIDQGFEACGLGARDTLRLEAGLNLYGSDMNDEITPLECGLEWTVSFSEDRNFIGKNALLMQKKNGIKYTLAGLILLDRGVLRSHQKVITDKGEGETTSGTFSPTLSKSIALAKIPVGSCECQVEIRGKKLKTQMVTYPFVRKGKAIYKELNQEETIS